MEDDARTVGAGCLRAFLYGLIGFAWVAIALMVCGVHRLRRRLWPTGSPSLHR
ncbi:hypothetical protein [Amycolatopsis thermophila]|uniref:Transmembrane protein n=1 Tax=Amycolatopsis thermophila TaxID=206084 RepID=A0ABU0EXV2_9PSEU|nr:hypothetical protein [Amycolatopsis thermophila]MDQ0380150.1 hypothetical protein [Amycolatopsis thermophila]